MRKAEFLRELRHHLRGIPEDELEDIVYDYEEHFRAGAEEGRSEDDIFQSLGDPVGIARLLRAEYMVKVARSTPSFRNMSNAALATLGLSFFKVIGFSLITVGLVLLLNQLNLIDFSWFELWPIFMIGLGVAFQVSYFSNPMKGKANISLLIPGGILTIVGLLFLFLVLTNFLLIARLWPIFVLAVAYGIFQFYYFGSRNGWFLIPITVLTAVGGIFLVNNLFSQRIFGLFLAVLFIVVGSLIGFRTGRRERRS